MINVWYNIPCISKTKDKESKKKKSVLDRRGNERQGNAGMRWERDQHAVCEKIRENQSKTVGKQDGE